jgi:hypothetical protein
MINSLFGLNYINYDRTMTALGVYMHSMHYILLEFTPSTAARRF